MDGKKKIQIHTPQQARKRERGRDQWSSIRVRTRRRHTQRALIAATRLRHRELPIESKSNDSASVEKSDVIGNIPISAIYTTKSFNLVANKMAEPGPENLMGH
ncbi:hypothetical protein NL676_037495 [Syzygium grande]|nr:hypothetical protein NL676_037495 [Syzygium grande]